MRNPLATELRDLARLHERALIDGGFLARNQGYLAHGTGGAGGSPLYNDPPWEEKPPGFIPFLPTGTAPLPLVGAQTVVLTIAVPDGYDGFVEKIGNANDFSGFVQGSGDIIWRVTADGRPIRNLDNITVENGTVRDPTDFAGFRIFSRQIIEFEVDHVANAALSGEVLCRLWGYFYPVMGS